MLMILRNKNNTASLAKATSQAVNAKLIGTPVFDEFFHLPVNHQNWQVSGFVYSKLLQTAQATSCSVNGSY